MIATTPDLLALAAFFLQAEQGYVVDLGPQHHGHRHFVFWGSHWRRLSVEQWNDMHATRQRPGEQLQHDAWVRWMREHLD